MSRAELYKNLVNARNWKHAVAMCPKIKRQYWLTVARMNIIEKLGGFLTGNWDACVYAESLRHFDTRELSKFMGRYSMRGYC